MNNLAENNSSFSSGTGIQLNPNIDTLLIDLWGTVARSDNREPIRDLQEILGYKVQSINHADVRSVDRDFLDFCLTTDVRDPERYAQTIGNRFGITATSEMVVRFNKVIEDESSCSMMFFDAQAFLQGAKSRGYRLILASNLWHFPVDCLFQDDNLGKYFAEKDRFCSYQEGVAKPDIAFFQKLLERMGVKPEQCMMIGDHLENDILPPVELGIQTALVDRLGKYAGDPRVLPEIIVVNDMQKKLLPMLPDRTKGDVA